MKRTTTKPCWILLVAVVVSAQSQVQSGPADLPSSRKTVADFGLDYPLPNDWILATELLRKQMQLEPPQNFDLLLAAVYVPKSDISSSSPFFSLVAYRQPATNCQKSLENVLAHPQGAKAKVEGGVTTFATAGRDYYRINLAHGVFGRHQAMICTTAQNHLLVWNAGAPNEKGLETIVSTLSSITPLRFRPAPDPTPPPEPKDVVEGKPQNSGIAHPQTVRVASGVTSGLLIKRVNPIYPDDARHNHIQGTVLLRAEINKNGDITDVELLDGPIELAGSAVSAVRQWKYRPYLLMGEPVGVITQIVVNYQLR